MANNNFYLIFAVGIVSTILSFSLAVHPIKLNQDQKLELGHFLFFDTRLSGTGTKSCSSCHDPQLAFTDGYRRSQGVFADLSLHNSPSLLNLDSYHSLNWKTPEIKSLKIQFLTPLFNHSPSELGLDSLNTTFINKLFVSEPYSRFHIAQQENWDICIDALEHYVKSLTSRNALFDKYLRKEESIDSISQKGFELFSSNTFRCYSCHGGLDFNTKDDIASDRKLPFHFNIKDSKDFRIPSLRNVTLTFPYMHDGSIEKLKDCFDLGNIENNNIRKITISENDKNAILHFLYTLTDTSYLSNPLFKNPFIWQ